MKHQNLHILSRKKLLYLHKEQSLAYAKGKLYFRDGTGEHCLGTYLESPVMKLAAHFRIPERVLRLEPRVCAALSESEFLISARGGIYRLDAARGTLEREHSYRPGMTSPIQICSDPGQPFYYGDYLLNAEKKAVSIHRREPDGHWETVFTFPDGTLNHIHAILNDPYRDQLVILTGDEGSSAGIWLADRDFTNVRPLIGGSQQYRTCMLIPMENGYLYATDSPNDPNYIFYLELDGDSRVKSQQKLAELPGPCIYGMRQGDRVFLSTCVETNPELRGLKYLFSRQPGRAITALETCILAVTNRNGHYQAEQIAVFQKDIWPMGLFQFGNVHFPIQDDGDGLVLCPIAVKKYDGKTVRIAVSAEKGS